MGAPAGLPEDDEREPPGTVQDRLGARGDTTPPARRASRGRGRVARTTTAPVLYALRAVPTMLSFARRARSS